MKTVASRDMAEPIEYQKIIFSKIDDAVCINLERRPGRWNAFSSRAANAGLDFIRRFNAIDGRTLDLPDHLKTHKGAYGCLHSHLAVFQEALTNKMSNLMVLEDDSEFPLGIEPIAEYLEATVGKFSWIHFGGCHSRPQILERFSNYFEASYVLNTNAYVIDSKLMNLYVDYLTNNPFPTSGLLHSDRLLCHLCRINSLKISVPPKSLAWQDKSLPRDVEWGVPKKLKTESDFLTVGRTSIDLNRL